MEKIIEILKNNKLIYYDCAGIARFNFEQAAKEIHDYKLSLEKERVIECIDNHRFKMINRELAESIATELTEGEGKEGKCDCKSWNGIDRNGFCRICGGEPRSILTYSEDEPKSEPIPVAKQEAEILPIGVNKHDSETKLLKSESTEYYQKVYINSDSINLPTKEGLYDTNLGERTYSNVIENRDKEYWILHITWYLHPVSPDKELIAKSGRKYRSIPDDVDLETWDNMTVAERLHYKNLIITNNNDVVLEEHTVRYLKSEHDIQIKKMTKIFGKKPDVFEQGVNALIAIVEGKVNNTCDNKDAIIQKQEEIIDKLRYLQKMNSWAYPTHRKFTDAKNTVKYEIVGLESELANLKK